jgi:hypothetical protein
MKKISILALFLLGAAGACKKKDEKPAEGTPPAGDKKPTDQQPVTPPAPPPAAAKLVPVDLSVVGEDWAGWSVQAPEGATAKESFGAANVTDGKSFNLEIRGDKGDIAAYKKESDANDINKVKRYLVDTPEALVYESEVMGQNEFHFYGNVTVGDKTFNCEDIKGPRHMQADVEAMWKSCQSLAKK